MSLRIEGASNSTGGGGIAELTYASPTLTLEDSTTAQSFRVMLTDDGAGNASWIEIQSANGYWSAAGVTTQASGSGVPSSIVLGVSNSGPAVLLQNGGGDGQLAYGGSAKLTWNATSFTALVPIAVPNYTVATLPSGAIGMRALVTDALGPVFLVAVVGGGAVVCPVFYDGSAWIVG